jgi:hypothetical protein
MLGFAGDKALRDVKNEYMRRHRADSLKIESVFIV